MPKTYFSFSIMWKPMVHNLDQILFIHIGSTHAHRHITSIRTLNFTIHGAIARTL